MLHRDQIFTPKAHGGLGFRVNKSLLAKQGWKWIEHPSSLTSTRYHIRNLISATQLKTLAVGEELAKLCCSLKTIFPDKWEMVNPLTLQVSIGLLPGMIVLHPQWYTQSKWFIQSRAIWISMQISTSGKKRTPLMYRSPLICKMPTSIFRDSLYAQRSVPQDLESNSGLSGSFSCRSTPCSTGWGRDNHQRHQSHVGTHLVSSLSCSSNLLQRAQLSLESCFIFFFN